MTDSIREKIVQQLATMAAGISKVNGYQTDIGLSGGRARRSFDEDELPAHSVWAGDSSPERSMSTSKVEMLVSFDGHHLPVEGKSIDAVVNMMEADLIKAIETYDENLYALIDGIAHSGTTPEYPDDGQSLCAISVSFTVSYTTKRGDPYTRP